MKLCRTGRDADGESDPLGDLEGAKNAARRLDDECREIERGETPRELVGTLLEHDDDRADAVTHIRVDSNRAREVIIIDLIALGAFRNLLRALLCRNNRRALITLPGLPLPCISMIMSRIVALGCGLL